MKTLMGILVLAVTAGCAAGPVRIGFDAGGDDRFRLESVDPGLSVELFEGQVRISGTTADSAWSDEPTPHGPRKGDRVVVPLDDRGGSLDVSGAFRVVERRGSGLVYLGLEGPKVGRLILIYEWHRMSHRYWIQRKYLRAPNTVAQPNATTKPSGQEKTRFSVLRIAVAADRRTVTFLVGKQRLSTITFEAPVGALTAATLEFQTPVRGQRFDIRFDDVVITQP